MRNHEVVLAIQDTTDFNFTTHPATKGLGFINQTTQQGIKVHSCLAVSGEGEPLGLLLQQHWRRNQRSGKKGQRRRKPIEEKESYRWLNTLSAAEQGIAESVQLIHIGDREADIFELFAQPRAANSEILIRAEHNRKVQHELDYLIPTLEHAPIVGEMTLELQRNPKRPAREAQFCQTVGVGYGAAVNSGTAALHLALRLVGVGPEDTVFCSTFTFVATANPILYLGATPVFVDSDRTSWNMDPVLFQEAIEQRAKRGQLPKAVVLVHLYGQSADIDPILSRTVLKNEG